MKAVMKILTALAAVAGIIYVLATYGDKIVAWAKKWLPSCDPDVEVTFTANFDDHDDSEESIEEAPEEAPEADSDEPVAEETDFEA